MNTTRTASQHASASEDSLQGVAQLMRDRDRPIRLRLPIQLWTGKEYIAWKQETWKIEVSNAAEAKQLRGVLEKLFIALGRGAAENVDAYLDGLLAFKVDELKSAVAAGVDDGRPIG